MNRILFVLFAIFLVIFSIQIFSNTVSLQIPVKKSFIEAIPPAEKIFEKNVTLVSGTGNVIFDASHKNEHSIFSDFSQFAALFKSAGYEIKTAEENLEKIEDTRAITLVTPTVNYSSNEIEEIRGAVENGASLIIISDRQSFIYLNQVVLEYDIIFNNDYIYDLVNHSENFKNPFIGDFENETISQNISQIVVYDACGLNVFGNAKPMAYAGKNAKSVFLNYREKIPMIATSQLGRGKVFAICDADIFTNEKIVNFDNEVFAKNIVSWI